MARLIYVSALIASCIAAPIFASDPPPAFIPQIIAPGTRSFDGVDVDGVLHFIAEDSAHGRELWTSDGTAGGTQRTTNFAGTGPAGFNGFVGVLEGQSIFLADDGTHGVELWRSNGQLSGTSLIKDINPTGSISVAGSHFQPAAVLNGRAYMLLGEPMHGVELWSTDGTSDGTGIVADLVPGSGGSNVQSFGDSILPVATTNAVYYAARAPTIGESLWRVNATGTGLELLADPEPNPTGGGIEPKDVSLFGAKHDIVAVGDRLFIGLNDNPSSHVDPNDVGYELWQSDGTPQGTGLVKDIVPGTTSTGRPLDGLPRQRETASQMTDLNGTLIFRPRDGRIWRSDGTEEGTQRVADEPVMPAFIASNPQFIAVGDTMFFSPGGSQLWRTDGTEAGTQIVRGFESGRPFPAIEVNDRLVFQLLTDTSSGREIETWISNGTADGTFRLFDNVGTTVGSILGGLSTAGDYLYFNAATDVDPVTGQGINPAIWSVQIPLPGGSQDDPVIPRSLADGVATFTNARSGDWFDPPGTSAFDFVMLSDTLFTSIIDFPTGFINPFTVSVDGAVLGQFGPGEMVDFSSFAGGGVRRFRISGIDPTVNSDDPTVFPIRLAFSQPTADFQMIGVVPTPAAIVAGFTGFALLAVRRPGKTGSWHKAHI